MASKNDQEINRALIFWQLTMLIFIILFVKTTDYIHRDLDFNWLISFLGGFFFSFLLVGILSWVHRTIIDW
jgi:hypothetical protein